MGKDEEAMLVYKEAESYIPRIKDNRIVTLIYMGLRYKVVGYNLNEHVRK